MQYFCKQKPRPWVVMKKFCVSRWLFLLFFIGITFTPVLLSQYGRDMVVSDSQDNRPSLDSSDDVHLTGWFSSDFLLPLDSGIKGTDVSTALLELVSRRNFSDSCPYAHYARLKPPPCPFVSLVQNKNAYRLSGLFA